MATSSRRDFLRMAAQSTGAVAAVAALPPGVARPLAAPSARPTGTIADVGHVVILMQENRSFDHYFGCLGGVRGFGDPRPLTLRNGKPVWHQPRDIASDVLPFPLRGAGGDPNDRSQCLDSDLPHRWKGSQKLWAWNDAWVREKGSTSMGYLTRAEIPFYYALADTFTIGDAYHSSMFGPTNPNRMFLFTGTNGGTVNQDGWHALANVDDLNWTSVMALDKPGWRSPYNWTTYAERLGAAGIGWKLYQEYDNYGCNSLAFFPQFRNLDLSQPDQQERYLRARAYAGETAVLDGAGRPLNTNPPDAQALVERIALDVRNGALPPVSWIVPPTKFCEHPATNPPAYGESLVARILDVLTADPAVWARTVFILCYDEEGGFFDHMPPPVPPATRSDGFSNVPATGEMSGGEPVGLGPRVPLLVMSPWTRGGWVCSEVFDHTSVLRFLEQRFGVAEPNISPWRRGVCGDLTSMFDFTRPDNSRPEHLFKVGHQAYLDHAERMCRGRKMAQLPAVQALPVPERAAGVDGTRPARPLPYRLQVDGALERAAERFRIRFENTGKAGAAFTVYAPRHNTGPWYYTLAAHTSFDEHWPLDGFKDRQYELRVDGPDGLLRVFRGSAASRAEAAPRAVAGELLLKLDNGYDRACRFGIADRAYGAEARSMMVAAGQSVTLAWPTAASHGWYDLELTVDLDPGFGRLFSGRLDSGAAGRSDPALGSALRPTTTREPAAPW